VARKIVIEAAIADLKQKRLGATGEEAHVLDDLLHQYEHRLEAVMDSWKDAAERSPETMRLVGLIRESVGVERETMIRLRDEERIGDEVLRRLEREMDLTDTKYSGLAE